MNLTCPIYGLRVVKGYAAILGKALVKAARREDLPAFGNPTNPMSANILSFNSIRLVYPYLPL